MAKKKSKTQNTEQPKSTGSQFDDFVNRQFGQGLIVQADTFVDRPREIISVTPTLDIALSGGIPEGKVVLISGKPKAGKTTLCLQILAAAIALGRRAFYLDIERRCDPTLLRTIRGLDMSKLTMIRSNEHKILSAEDWLKTLERLVKDVPRAVIVVDSLAMLSMFVEQTEAVGESAQMGGVPKLMSGFFRKMQDFVDINNAVLIFLNQLQTGREPKGAKYTEKGGMAVQYACSIWISVDWFQIWDKDSQLGEPLGQDVMCKIKASALGKPYRPCALPLRYGEGIDVPLDVIRCAENLSLIERNGSWYTIPCLGGVKFQGAGGVRQFLVENPEKLEHLNDNIRKIVLGDCNGSQTSQRQHSQDQPEEVPAETGVQE